MGRQYLKGLLKPASWKLLHGGLWSRQDTESRSMDRQAKKHWFFLSPTQAWLESLRAFSFMSFRKHPFQVDDHGVREDLREAGRNSLHPGRKISQLASKRGHHQCPAGDAIQRSGWVTLSPGSVAAPELGWLLGWRVARAQKVNPSVPSFSSPVSVPVEHSQAHDVGSPGSRQPVLQPHLWGLGVWMDG